MKKVFYILTSMLCVYFVNMQNVHAQKEMPKQEASVQVIIGVDANCNKQIDKNEYGNSSFTATLSGNGINRSGTGSFSGVLFSNVPYGSYTVTITCSYEKNGTTQNLSGTYTANVNSNDGAFIQGQLFPNCNVAPPPPPPPPPVEVKCGGWKNAYINAQPSSNFVGSTNILNRENVMVTKLRTEVEIDLDYVTATIKQEGKKDRTERCPVSGTIKFPNGNTQTFTNDTRFSIMMPGTYVISWEVKCGNNICESGTKVLVCNDPIVCNCGPADNNNLKISSSGQSTNGFIANGTPILIDKSVKSIFSKAVKCEGNVCDGYVDYKVVDDMGKVYDGGRLYGRIRFSAPNDGKYTLVVTEFCGNKNCNVYKYPLSFVGENKNEYYHNYVRGRWGIQAGYYRGFASMDRTNSTRGYGTGLLGLIADIPMGYAKRWHFWPQLNIYGTTYRSKATPIVASVPQPLDIRYCNLMGEFTFDFSYAIPINKKSFIHLYAGASINGYLKSKAKYTSTVPQAVTAWKAGNLTNDTIGLPGKVNLGLLYDINRNWVVGLNYYKLATQKQDVILAKTYDKGFGLRVAYFFDTRRKR